jgi:hypothetical protein
MSFLCSYLSPYPPISSINIMPHASLSVSSYNTPLSSLTIIHLSSLHSLPTTLLPLLLIQNQIFGQKISYSPYPNILNEIHSFLFYSSTSSSNLTLFTLIDLLKVIQFHILIHNVAH